MYILGLIFFWLKKVFIIAFPIYIIFDFVRDLILIKIDKEKAISEIKYDILRIVLIGVFFVIVCLFFPEINRPNYINHLLKKDDIKYISVNKEVDELVGKIKNEYDIDVYPKIDATKIYNIYSYNVDMEGLSESTILKVVQDLYNSLSIYNEKSISRIPHEIYIVGNIHSKTGIASGLNIDSKAITLSAMAEERTIHHEIFHTLDNYVGIKNYMELHKSLDRCSLISNYACTNDAEQAAEAWEYSIVDNKDNIGLIDFIKTLYPKFLKGFSDESKTDISSLNYDYSKYDSSNLFNELNQNEKKVYAYLDNIFDEGNKSFSINKQEGINAYEAYVIDNDVLDNQIKFIYNDDTSAFYISNLEKDNYKNKIDDLNKRVDTDLKLVENIEGIEKIEAIYYELVKQNMGEESYFNDYSDVNNLNSLLKMFLTKLDYKIYNPKKHIDDDIQGIIIEYDNNKYWLDVEDETEHNTFMLNFMVNDDYYFRNTKKEIDNKYCIDEKLSYYYRHELYLNSFDKNRIVNYIVKKLKKRSKDAKLIIVCENIDIYEQVKEYLLSKDNRGHINLQIIYQQHLGPNYCGCTYIYDSENLLIYVNDFKY